MHLHIILSIVLLDEGHIWVIVLRLLRRGEVDPRQQTVQKQSKGILIHIYGLSLRLSHLLLVVLDIVQIYSLCPIAEVMSVYLGISCETERDWQGFYLL